MSCIGLFLLFGARLAVAICHVCIGINIYFFLFRGSRCGWDVNECNHWQRRGGEKSDAMISAYIVVSDSWSSSRCCNMFPSRLACVLLYLFWHACICFHDSSVVGIMFNICWKEEIVQSKVRKFSLALPGSLYKPRVDELNVSCL